MTAPVDRGLQVERTELAWRRTALALVVAAIAAARVLSPVLGDWAVLVGAVGLIVTAVLWAVSRRRCQRYSTLFDSASKSDPAPGAGPLLALAMTATTAAVLGAVYSCAPHS